MLKKSFIRVVGSLFLSAFLGVQILGAQDLQVQGWNQYYTGDFKGAIKSFSEVLKGEVPKKELGSIFLGLGYSQLSTGNLDEAKKNFEMSLEENKSFDAYRGLGMVAFHKKEYKEAIKQFQASIKKGNPNRYEMDSLIAWSYFRDGDSVKAQEGFRKQILVNPYIADVHYGIALTLDKMGDKKSALAEFYAVLSLAPGYLANDEFFKILESTAEYKPLQKDLAWGLYFAGFGKQSFSLFEKVLKNEPENAETLRGASYAAYKASLFDKSIEYSKKSLAKNPNLAPLYEVVYDFSGSYGLYSDAQTTLAWSHYKKGEIEKAMDAFQDALKVHSDWPDANSGLGWVLYAQKRYTDAEEYFNKALKVDPKYLDAYSGLAAVANAKAGKAGEGWRLYYSGLFEKAIDNFNEEWKKEGLSQEQRMQIQRGLGWCNLKLKRYGEAENNFRTLVSASGDDYDAKLGLGYVLYHRGETPEAVRYLKQAVKAYPLDADAEIALGWSQYKNQNFADSLIEFRRAAQLNPYIAEPLRGLGLSLLKLGRGEEGKANLVAAINLYPQGSDTEELRNLIQQKKELNDLVITFAWAYYNYGQFNKAQEKVKSIKEMGLNYPDIGLLSGYISYKDKKYADAVKELTAYLKNAPESEPGYGKYSEAWNTLGWVYIEMKDFMGAIQAFEKLAQFHKADDIWAAPYDGLGWTYLKMGEKGKATQMFNKSLQLAPGYLSSLAGLNELKKN